MKQLITFTTPGHEQPSEYITTLQTVNATLQSKVDELQAQLQALQQARSSESISATQSRQAPHAATAQEVDTTPPSIGNDDYNSATTKIVHLRQNPIVWLVINSAWYR